MSLLDAKQIKNLAQKLPVRAITTAALPANTYANGTSGFGATLTGNANGALPAQDGVTLVVGNRLLVKDEVAPEKNGIYIVTQLGSVGTVYILTRASDADTAVKTFPGISVFSTNDGTTNGLKEYVLATITSPLIIGTTAQTWSTQAITSPVPTSSNKEMVANATSADFQAATATAIVSTPANDGYVQVFVNGQKQNLGNGVRTKDCYFSDDAGATAKTIANITAGDILYWVGSVASWQLGADDRIDFDYNV